MIEGAEAHDNAEDYGDDFYGKDSTQHTMSESSETGES